MTFRLIAVFWLGAVPLMLAPTITWARVITASELCDHGDAEMCRIAELEQQISESGLFGAEGRYDWKPSTNTLNQIVPRNSKERVARLAQEFCTLSEAVWINRDVEAYARSLSLVAVDRSAYDTCITERLEIEGNAASLKTLTTIARWTGVAALSFVFFGALWYRRPLFRGLCKLLRRIHAVGAE